MILQTATGVSETKLLLLRSFGHFLFIPMQIHIQTVMKFQVIV